MVGAGALLAFRRGDNNDEAELGAAMEADYQARVVTLIEALQKKR